MQDGPSAKFHQLTVSQPASQQTMHATPTSFPIQRVPNLLNDCCRIIIIMLPIKLLPLRVLIMQPSCMVANHSTLAENLCTATPAKKMAQVTCCDCCCLMLVTCLPAASAAVVDSWSAGQPASQQK
jgi:hypothetical protein